MSVAQAGSVDEQQIIARLERLPISRWHNWMRGAIGTAWFFDAFDALAIAYVLPVLIPMWHLTPPQIGLLISAGYVGQLLGSVIFGWLAERFGRVPVSLVTLLIFAVMSFACVFAWDLNSMLAIRFVQGLGLGGETPVMHAYVNEFAKSKNRGRFTLTLQMVFGVGIVATALVGTLAVPNLGWQSMFLIGALPAFLALTWRRVLPESPRWLASRGRFAEADAVVSKLEQIAISEGKSLPPLPANLPQIEVRTTRLADLFSGIYLRRTLSIWTLWFCTYLVTYGLGGWLPSIYRTIYKLDVQTALLYGFISSVAGLVGSIFCTFAIDHTGRKRMFSLALVATAIPLAVLSLVPDLSVKAVLVLVSICSGFNFIVAMGLGMFTAENYPNHLRAVGGGLAGVWPRCASIIGPFMIGMFIPLGGLPVVFAMMSIVSLIGAAVCMIFSVETGGRVLETISSTADDKDVLHDMPLEPKKLV